MASMANTEEDEDDYLAMSFDEPVSKPGKETSLQRTTRLKKEAAERGRLLSKKELAERQERHARRRSPPKLMLPIREPK